MDFIRVRASSDGTETISWWTGDVYGSGMADVPSVFSWCRVSPWLPWMAMAQRPGGLVYHCRGGKTAEVPERLRERVGERFLHAPERWSGPNMTSWTAYAGRADTVGR
jgi:hypothetical protein